MENIILLIYLAIGTFVTAGLMLVFPRKMKALKGYPPWMRVVVILINIAIFPIAIVTTTITEIKEKKNGRTDN